MSLSQASIDELLADAGAMAESASAPADPPTPPPSQPALEPTTAPASVPTNLRRILGLSVPVSVVVAEHYMPVEAILDIKVGTIIEFDVMFDSDLTLAVADRPIGHGQAVKIGENFGLRVGAIEDVRERIDAMSSPDD